jgi:hypothetical protein
VNWIINIGILVLIVCSYVANRQGAFGAEKRFAGSLVLAMVVVVIYGVLKLRAMQTAFDARRPDKEKEKEKK